ncbi:MAG: alpha-xylosidase [Lachnospiraceae bacterium]|nr:alpha-xylosidase [Lachnospiraceae bacterium]
MNNYSNDRAMVRGDKYRFTVLTSGLLRLEYQEDGIFEDRMTQRVVNRNFEVPEFTVKHTEDQLEIITEFLHLRYNKKQFSSSGLAILVNGNGCYAKWNYGDEIYDLKGTARTLDGVNGPIALEHGVLSSQGFTVLDDSSSVILEDNGWITPRERKGIDLYFFGYGHAYERCLKDFYRLTGPTPLIPRFALGNWWSRYYPYTEVSYQELVRAFEKARVPLSVAVIDMDWHLVDIDPKYGTGWTGYTWNEDLFPNYKRFLAWLHDRGLKVSLNVHPADGIRGFEKQYPEMAKRMQVDWEKEEPVEFDLTNPEFMKAYFEIMCHPYEEDGVDFWWLDWQQGGISKMPDLDPLWMLNHCYYLDSKRNGKRGITFSRYAGIGSHRYPIGFSGDTIVTWESLDFQPYFTATASNCGYGWWSHDIGGHMLGYKDEELLTRWVQLGIFSPIMRLHSSNNSFIHKEPWMLQQPYSDIICHYLRMRHEMLPYLYSMNVIAAREGQPLVRPMYYLNPEKREAYKVPNEFYFGTELLVCPITQKTDESGMACFHAWLPEGKWIDIFNGRIYDGDRKITMVRCIREMPVLAKAGAIVPYGVLQEGVNGVENPEELNIKIFAGDNGCFHMYEDLDDNEAWADTEFAWDWERKEFRIKAAVGAVQSVPEKRTWTLDFYGVEWNDAAEVWVNGQKNQSFTYDRERNILTVKIGEKAITEEICVALSVDVQFAGNHIQEQMVELFRQVQMMPYDDMLNMESLIKKKTPINRMVSFVNEMNIPDRAKDGIFEILLAD